jgi:precorrin-6Y C5,15-methyltransferase (decarboxylating)
VPEAIAVVGVGGDVGGPGGLGKDAARALEGADLVVGATRHLDALAPTARRRLVVGGDLGAVLDAVDAERGRVCVLASGDPGFFGIVRALAARFGPEALEVHPAPSSVALAFARLGLPWDDAVVVSAHGRSLAEAATRAATVSKAAVLTSPEASPQALGAALVALGARHHRVVVASRLGDGDETVSDTDLAGLAGAEWDPRSVVVLLDGPPVATAPVLAWGLPDGGFAHRQGMLTKAEVRAVALGKLALPPAGVLWDVGAGSGSVAVECARLAPALRVVAVERDAADAARIRANTAAHGVAVEVVEDEAPACLRRLPAPDRAFVGGGGLTVLDAVLARLAPGGRVVATYAAVDRAAAAAGRLGRLVQVAVSRGEHLPGGGLRLAAENPVFVVWGPEE